MQICVSKGSVKLHDEGPLVQGDFQYQYLKYIFDDFTLTRRVPDNCCQIGDDVVLIENFVKKIDKSEFIIGRHFSCLTDLFVNPCRSKSVGIYRASDLSGLHVYPIEMVRCKCMCLPLLDRRNTFAIIPLLHNILNND